MGNDIKVGSVTGTGAAINVSIGFQPSYVKVYNPNDAGGLYPIIEWWNGMAAASGLKSKKNVIASVEASLDFASIAAASVGEVTVNVTGAALGDNVYASPKDVIEANLAFSAYVTAANTVAVRAVNPTAAAIDPAAVAWEITVMRGNNQDKITSGGISKYAGSSTASEGFTIGADADINASGEDIFYIAHR